MTNSWYSYFKSLIKYTIRAIKINVSCFIPIIESNRLIFNNSLFTKDHKYYRLKIYLFVYVY